MNRPSLLSPWIPVAVCAFSVVAGSVAVKASAQRRVVSPIDETRRVTLAGNTRPEATAENDLGEVEDSLPLEHMQLLLRRSDKVQKELDDFTESLADPDSPNYHHWLTAAEFGARYGVDKSDIETVTDWLEGHGFTVNTVYPNRMTIDFTGAAANVREAFSTEIHGYEVKGVHHIANNRDPQIPAALAPVITGVVSLHDFRPHSMLKPKTDFTFTDSSGTWYALTPPDLATIYNLNPLFKAGYTGKGQTIVVVEDTNLFGNGADWTTFRKKFGLSGYTSGSLTTVHPQPPSGAHNCANPGINLNGDDGEAILDAEWASAAAPNARIEVASCSNTSTLFGGQIALQNLLNESKTPPAIVSVSYGDCESDMGHAANAAFKALYQQAVAESVSVFVSSGDESAASCDAGNATATHGIAISGFASTIYNVAVGGTDFADSYLNKNSTYWNSSNTASFGSAKSYIPEIPWNDSCASTLLAKVETGSAITYGTSGFCNSKTGEANFLGVTGGSGGPSACATGTPSIPDVTSGTCKGWPKPSWQSLVGVPADGVRDIPDVSLFAANGVWSHYFVFCYSDVSNGGTPCTGSPAGWSGAGGTSFSSPIMAGIQSLINQKTGKRWGNPNPIYYKIAKTEYGTTGSATCNSSKGNAVGAKCVFYDVTLGDMDTNCTGTRNCYRPSGTNGVLSTSNTAYKPAYKTTTGWDFATGIGTINAYNLVMNSAW